MTIAPILAIDPASKSGWALFDGTFHRHGSFVVTGERPARFLAFECAVADLIADIRPRLIVFESQDNLRGAHVRRLLGGFAAIIELVAERTGTASLSYTPSAIKKAVAGKGTADKQAVIAAVKARGFYPRDDNEADALALLFCAQADIANGSIKL